MDNNESLSSSDVFGKGSVEAEVLVADTGFWHGSGCDRVRELAFERGTA